MKKYIYIPTGNKVWIDVAIDLYKRGVAEPVLWLGDDRHYPKAREVFGEVVMSKQDFVFYPERIKDIKYRGENIDFFISDNYLRAKDRCLKMMDRLDIYGTFGRIDREVIFNKLAMWALRRIEKIKPNAMVVSETPHSHTYYLIYEISLYLNLEVVKFNTWPTTPLLFLQDMRTGLRFKKDILIDNEITKKIQREVLSYVDSLAIKENDQNYELSYMEDKRLQKKFDKVIINFFKLDLILIIKEFWFQFRMYFNPIYYSINPYKLGLFGRYKIKRSRKKNLYKAHTFNQEKLDLTTQYVYFALHYEPERTTNPDGGAFHDQLLAITRLRSILPSSLNIIVKEHPSQFYLSDRGSRGRSPIFYECLKNIEGVKLSSISENPLNLIRNSVFVSTISGSTAFESAIIGKQVLVFGDAWFNGCPNVTLWNRGLTFEEMMQKETLSKDKIIEYLLNEKRLYCVPGCLNPSAQKRCSSYLDESFYNLEFKGISHLLEKFFSKL